MATPSTQKFWVENPTALFQNGLNFMNYSTREERYNSLSLFVIFIAIITIILCAIYEWGRKTCMYTMVTTIVILVVLIFCYYSMRSTKEGYQPYTIDTGDSYRNKVSPVYDRRGFDSEDFGFVNLEPSNSRRVISEDIVGMTKIPDYVEQRRNGRNGRMRQENNHFREGYARPARPEDPYKYMSPHLTYNEVSGTIYGEPPESSVPIPNLRPDRIFREQIYQPGDTHGYTDVDLPVNNVEGAVEPLPEEITYRRKNGKTTLRTTEADNGYEGFEHSVEDRKEASQVNGYAGRSDFVTNYNPDGTRQYDKDTTMPPGGFLNDLHDEEGNPISGGDYQNVPTLGQVYSLSLPGAGGNDPASARYNIIPGVVQYHFRERSPYPLPNFITRSKIDEIEFEDPLGRVYPEYPYTASYGDIQSQVNDRTYADELMFRESMTSSLYDRRNRVDPLLRKAGKMRTNLSW
jgi:hypothetical protein